MLKRAWLEVQVAMAYCAVHRVRFDSINQVLICHGHRVIYARSMTLHGGVQCVGRDFGFERGRRGIGVGWNQAELRDNQRDRKSNHNRDDNPENEVAHLFTPLSTE